MAIPSVPTSLETDRSAQHLVVADGTDRVLVGSVREGRAVRALGASASVQIGVFTLDDSRMLLARESTRELPLVPLSTEELRSELCRRAARNFTPAEWRERFPREEYRRTCLAHPVPEPASRVDESDWTGRPRPHQPRAPIAHGE